MKAYAVDMHQKGIIPLNQEPPAEVKTKGFDTEQEALDFAKDVKNNYDLVRVRKTVPEKVIAEFSKDDI